MLLKKAVTLRTRHKPSYFCSACEERNKTLGVVRINAAEIKFRTACRRNYFLFPRFVEVEVAADRSFVFSNVTCVLVSHRAPIFDGLLLPFSADYVSATM